MIIRNGQLPASMLVMTSAGKYLAADAAASFERLAVAFRARFGKPLLLTWGYRSLADQWDLFHRLGRPTAAVPGTSRHGWGQAGDFVSGIETYGSPEWVWMNTLGRTYGWLPLEAANPTIEPWHHGYYPSADQHLSGTTSTPQEDDVTPDELRQALDERPARAAFRMTGTHAVYLDLGAARRRATQDQLSAYGIAFTDIDDPADSFWDLPIVGDPGEVYRIAGQPAGFLPCAGGRHWVQGPEYAAMHKPPFLDLPATHRFWARPIIGPTPS